jgi:hypothetical protein
MIVGIHPAVISESFQKSAAKACEILQSVCLLSVLFRICASVSAPCLTSMGIDMQHSPFLTIHEQEEEEEEDEEDGE